MTTNSGTKKRTKSQALKEFESFNGLYKDNPFNFDEFFKVDAKTFLQDVVVILATCSILIGIAIYMMRLL